MSRPVVARHALMGTAVVVAALAVAGCNQMAQRPATGSTPVTISQGSQVQALAEKDGQIRLHQQQIADLQNQLATIKQDNQRLDMLLAQSRQQAQILREQTTALSQQLNDTTGRLTQLGDEKSTAEERVRALQASADKYASSFKPNSSVQAQLRPIELRGVEVRTDGDVVRVELPADKLFDTGTDRLSIGGRSLLDSVAAELQRTYPKQMIGVEGYADRLPGDTTADATLHQRTSQQANAVLGYLTGTLRMNPRQFFVVAHGGNHPVVSNGTEAGRARNRRVELVVYPEQFQ